VPNLLIVSPEKVANPLTALMDRIPAKFSPAESASVTVPLNDVSRSPKPSSALITTPNSDPATTEPGGSVVTTKESATLKGAVVEPVNPCVVAAKV